MERKLPVWFFLLCLLLGLLFTVAFGWSVKSTLAGSTTSGAFGRMAVEISNFPTITRTAFSEVVSYSTGNEDQWIRVPRPDVDLSRFRPIRAAEGIDIEGLLFSADTAELDRGWRMLVGHFVLGGEPEMAALLLSPDLEVVKTWVLQEIPIGEQTPRSKFRNAAHGVTLLEDGSLIAAYDHGISLQRFDRCGNRQWAIPGNYHHAVTPHTTGQSVWTLRGDSIVHLSTEDGQTIDEISLEEIIDANPKIDILQTRRDHRRETDWNERNAPGEWLTDPFHMNDVDPIPDDLAGDFPGFDAGDLLVSVRNLNLLMVVDPQSLKVKWWRVGATERQHDPDWRPGGTITIFNNRMSRDYSEIVEIDPVTFQKITLFDGRQHDFFSRVRGKHELTLSGHLLITSAQQGRAFEVNEGGNIVLEIVNTKSDSDDANYLITEFQLVPWDMTRPVSMSCEN